MLISNVAVLKSSWLVRPITDCTYFIVIFSYFVDWHSSEANCTCVAGLSEVCSHIAAVFFSFKLQRGFRPSLA